MEQEQLSYILVKDFIPTGSFDSTIGFKPKIAPVVCLIVGAAMLIPNNLFVRILGLFFVVMAALVMYVMKDKKVADVYSDGVLIYNSKNQDYAYFLNYNDVKMWKVDHEEGHDTIVFTLNSLYRTGFDTFQSNKAYRALEKYIGDKDEKLIRAQELRKIGPSDLIKRLRDKLFKK
ncbi:MAG: hypothetical protein Q4E33_05500 [Erysipelotrichaceae bacterium]|nr:hypothetical protein [Erysipelotrichaceae bacterium]